MLSIPTCSLDLRSRLESVPRAHYSSRDGCLKGTRETLLANVDTWVREPSGEGVVWIHGHAGSGKSALLNSVAESLEKAGIPFTYFPCKRDDPELSNIHRMLPTIAYGATEYYGDYRAVLSDVVKKPEGRSILTGDVKKQFELLFGESYELISPSGSSRPIVHVILIDALDECRNHHDEAKTAAERRALLRVLLDLANKLSWIKVIITSRPEPDITKVLGGASSGANRVDINSTNWDTDADIRAFIGAKSEEMALGLSVSQVEDLVVKAAGLFVWCATVFRYIDNRRSPGTDTINAILGSPSTQARDKPFKSLYELYQRVLDSAGSDDDDKALVESVLSVVFVTSSRQPLSADAIADILYPNERGSARDWKREWVGNVVSCLFAIVYVEEGTGSIRTCHPSVLDFIEGLLDGKLPASIANSGGSPVKGFSIRLEEAHMRVFNGCFAVMKSQLGFNICELEDSFLMNGAVRDLSARIKQNISEVLQYGILFWMSHREQSRSKERDEQVFAFLDSRKALFWIESLGLLGVVDRGIVALQDCAPFFAVRRFCHCVCNS